MAFEDVFAANKIVPPFVASGQIAEEGTLVSVPSSTQLHASLLRAFVEDQSSLTILTPTDAPDLIQLLALEGLFGPTIENRERDAVLVLSANTEVRERFRHLAPSSELPPHDQAVYSVEEAPIANVKADGSLAKVTKNYNYPEKDPRFLFSYTSKRVPTDEVGRRVRCVIYEDNLKFRPERLERLRRWRDRNDVPTLAFVTNDPLGDLYEAVKDFAAVWSWPDELLAAGNEADVHGDFGAAGPDSSEGPPTARRASYMVQRQQNRLQSVEWDVHVCGGDETDDLFARAETGRRELEGLVREIQAEPLWDARRLVRNATQAFQELLTPLDVHRFHARQSIQTRLKGLRRFESQIDADPAAQPAAGAYRTVVEALEALEEAWVDVDGSETKAGQLVSLLYAALERGESVTVVTPTNGARRALGMYLQTEEEALYRDLKSNLAITSAQDSVMAECADNAILYGALRYDQRHLLRSALAQKAIVLAYPVEFGLLYSQVRAINESFADLTDTKFWSVAEGLTKRADGDGPYSHERVDLDVPDKGERVNAALGEDVSVFEAEAGADLGDMVRTYEPEYEATEGEYEPDISAPEAGGSESGSRRLTQTLEGCLDLRFADGRAMYVRPDDELTVLHESHERLLDKRATAVDTGDLVVHLHDTEEARELLYELIKERGDVGLYYYANMWKVNLEAALEETGDDLEDFVEKIEEQLPKEAHKWEGTYEKWYTFEVRRTRSKDSMKAIVEAYDLETVRENFERVWRSVHEMETIYSHLKDALEEHALGALERGEDVLISESPDVRLSDFDVDRYVNQLEVVKVSDGVEAPRSRIGELRTP